MDSLRLIYWESMSLCCSLSGRYVGSSTLHESQGRYRIVFDLAYIQSTPVMPLSSADAYNDCSISAVVPLLARYNGSLQVFDIQRSLVVWIADFLSNNAQAWIAEGMIGDGIAAMKTTFDGQSIQLRLFPRREDRTSVVPAGA